jgi:hypothetical protein
MLHRLLLGPLQRFFVPAERRQPEKCNVDYLLANAVANVVI